MKEGVVDDRFVRTCPDGVKSCFGATGFYDHRDTDPTNDISKLLLKILGSPFVMGSRIHFHGKFTFKTIFYISWNYVSLQF